MSGSQGNAGPYGGFMGGQPGYDTPQPGSMQSKAWGDVMKVTPPGGGNAGPYGGIMGGQNPVNRMSSPSYSDPSMGRGFVPPRPSSPFYGGNPYGGIMGGRMSNPFYSDPSQGRGFVPPQMNDAEMQWMQSAPPWAQQALKSFQPPQQSQPAFQPPPGTFAIAPNPAGYGRPPLGPPSRPPINGTPPAAPTGPLQEGQYGWGYMGGMEPTQPAGIGPQTRRSTHTPSFNGGAKRYMQMMMYGSGQAPWLNQIDQDNMLRSIEKLSGQKYNPAMWASE